jgi:flagellar hook-length control protein FliK
MNESAIALSEAAAKAAAAPPVKSAPAEGRSSGALFFELLSSALAGSLAIQAGQDTPAPQVTDSAPERTHVEVDSKPVSPETAPERRPQTSENRYERGDASAPREKAAAQPAHESVHPERPERSESTEKQTAGREAAAGREVAEGREATASQETTKGRETVAEESPGKPEVRSERSEEVAKQTAPAPQGKPSVEAAKTVIKAQVEGAPPEAKPTGDTEQVPLKQAARPAPSAEIVKPAETAKPAEPQQQAARNAADTGAARQAQEAPRPTNIVDITQLLSRAAAKAVQDTVQPSTDSQGAWNGGEQAAGQAETTAAMQELMNAGVEAQAQAGKAAFAAALQSQVSTTAPQPGQQAQPTVQVVPAAAAGPAARAAESPARPAETEAPRLPLPPERVVNQVIRAARLSIGEGREEIKLLLKPESLGWIKMKVTVEGQNVTARITVEHEGVRDLLEGNVRQLQQALNNQNLKVGQIIIELSGDAERQARESADNGSSKGKLPTIAAIAGGREQVEQSAPAAAEEDVYRITQIDLRV